MEKNREITFILILFIYNILTYIETRYILKTRREQIFLHITIDGRYIMNEDIRKE